MTGKNPNIFPFRRLEEFKKHVASKGLEIPITDKLGSNISHFKDRLVVEGKSVPNRFCIQPMEGCDGEPDGSPSELTFRKYERFARGGSGLIWVEATAVLEEGKANPRQLYINEKSAPKFRQLADTIRNNSFDESGKRQNPFLVLQLTHSGRYSKPYGKAAPIIFHHSPVLDPTHKLDGSYPLVTDEYLDALQEKFITAAKFAYDCGYDAVDIKSCHGYLLEEILTAHTRTDSRYGGALENRTRLLTEIAAKIKKEVPGLIVTTRVTVYDAYPYPYGWGMKKDGSMEPDLSEPFRLIEKLQDIGISMVNITFGNPYYNPHIGRPYDYPIQGFGLPEEHPLKITERNIRLTSEIKRKFPGMTIVSVGYTWLRELFPHVCTSMLMEGRCDVIGLGRGSLAYPDYVNEFLKNGKVLPEKTCITCSSCTQIMRDGGKSGCVIRDAEVYAPIYYSGRLSNEVFVRDLAQNCRNCWGAACKGNCPAGVDVPRFINAFYDGNIKGAYEIIRENNLIPETCAYTCPAEALCEKSCTAGILSKNTVPVHEIQKFISVEARKKGWTKVNASHSIGKKVAVIGFGPAGIACSTYLVEKGCNVTVFEASCKAGGTADAVIPFERLPENVMEEEVKSFGLEDTGLFEIRYNKKIDMEFNLDNIFQEGFDAVFIGAGMSENTGLTVEHKPEGVYEALDFLNNIKKGCLGKSLPDKAAVIGGGNTAMDAAVSLKNNGVKDVYLIYRRSFMELPAWPLEVEKALHAGVHFIILSQPLDYVEKDGRLSGIKLVHTQLGENDSSGRPAPVALPGSEYVFPVSVCIEATGQKVSKSLACGLPGVDFEKGKIKIVKGKCETSRKNVFAGGDIINGGQTVVLAVKEGLDAAKEILGSI